MQEIGAAERLARLRRWAVLMLGGVVAVLVVTGAYLWFRYQPTSVQSWPGAVDGGPSGWQLAHVARTVHRWASFAAVALAVVIAGLALGEAIERRGSGLRPVAWVLGAAVLLLGTVGASVSGFLLPWDQLALKAVTVGTDLSGLAPLFGDRVRFVIIGGAEVSVSTVRTVAILHLALTAVVAVSVVVLSPIPRSRRDRPQPTPLHPTTNFVGERVAETR